MTTLRRSEQEQAAETALKALYIEQHDTLPPYIHDLEQLGRLVGGVPPAIETDLITVNPAFRIARYPAPGASAPPSRLVDETAARTYAEAAERIPSWVTTQLP
jgi:HEPN domain-containing protein